MADNSILKWVKMSNTAIEPKKGTTFSAGFDLYSDSDVIIGPHTRKLIIINIGVILPHGTMGWIASRSGLALKNNIDVCGGIIDEDYRKSIGVILHNHSDVEFKISHGDRIAQFIMLSLNKPNKVECYDEKTAIELPDWNINSDRIGGFGSTGK